VARGRDEVGEREARIALLLGGDAHELRGASFARYPGLEGRLHVGMLHLGETLRDDGQSARVFAEVLRETRHEGRVLLNAPLTDSSRKARKARPKEAGDGTAWRSSPRPSLTGAL